MRRTSMEEIHVFETSRAAHVQDLSMQCNNTTIGTCNAIITEAIGGGAVENEPSMVQLEEPIEVLRMGYISDISGYFRLAAAMFEGSNVQWRLGKIAFHIADKLRRQLTRQG